jgi:hypothetical protein
VDEVVEQLEDLGPDRHVEARDRLVGDDELGLGGEGASDDDPLPLTTGEAPAFLDEVRRWFAAILPLLAERLEPLGGNVIGLQLDNEIGMLAWVSNTPDLTLRLDVDEHLRVQVLGSTETSVARRGRQVTVDAAAPYGLTVRFVAQPTTA